MIGTALSEEAIREGWDVTILSRSPGPGKMVWNPSENKIDIQEKQNYDAIINLAGTSITNGRWTQNKKLDIRLSRINACNTLEKYLHDGLISTSFYLGASAVGIYGDHGKETVSEETMINRQDDWFVRTVIDWEMAHTRIAASGIRTVILRIGIVLSLKGGAIKEIISTPGYPVLSYFGHGDQIWPCIHISDLARMCFFCINHPEISGLFLATCPNPVSNKYFTQAINKFISPKRMVMGVPKFMMSTLLGEMHRVLFESCNATSTKIQNKGFTFNFNEINEALKNLLLKEKK